MEVGELLKDKLEMFKNLYDFVIIIDPVEKKSVAIVENSKQRTNQRDRLNLERQRVFNDDICMDAFLHNDTFVKIECLDGKTLLINASPIIFEGKVYIIKTIKDITTNSTLVINDKENSLETSISKINERIVKDYLTGTFNRRYIDERLPMDIINSIKNGIPLTIIMADIIILKKLMILMGI